MKETVLGIIWFAILLLTLGACYKVYFLDKDFQVLTYTDCDPVKEVCFVADCTEGVESDLCRSVSLGRSPYFHFIKKQASQIEACDARQEECLSAQCLPGEAQCEVIHCDDQTLSLYGDETMSCTEKNVSEDIDNSVPPESILVPETTPILVEPSSPEVLTPDSSSIDTAPEENIPVESIPSESTDEQPLEEPSHNLPI